MDIKKTLPEGLVRANTRGASPHTAVACIYGGQQNRIRYEKYGRINYNYDPYYDYYADWPPNNPPPIEPRETEIFRRNPNRPFRKPPRFEKENRRTGRQINDRLKRNGESQRKSEATKFRIYHE